MNLLVRGLQGVKQFLEECYIDKELPRLKETLETQRKSHDQKGVVKTLSEIVVHCISNGKEYVLAKEKFKEAFSMVEFQDLDPLFRAKVLGAMGDYNKALCIKEKAMDFYKRAIEVVTENLGNDHSCAKIFQKKIQELQSPPSFFVCDPDLIFNT